MSKREIIILIIVFFMVLIISIFVSKYVSNSKEKLIDNELVVGEYTLKYGKYKGQEEEYNYEKETIEYKEIVITLTKDKINNESYEVKGNSLYVNHVEMYKVTANNEMILLAGAGVEFKYER